MPAVYYQKHCLNHPPQIHRAGVGVVPLYEMDTWGAIDNWRLHLYDYEATVSWNGVPHPVERGLISLTSPGNEMRWAGLEDKSYHLYFNFQPTVSKTVKNKKNASAQEPLFISLGTRHAEFREKLALPMACYFEEPTRATAYLWHSLWELWAIARKQEEPVRSHESLLEHCCQHIELNLSNKLSVPELAKAFSISQRQLSVLFKRRFGETVVGYIRHRRCLKAKELLETTTLPIKLIAYEIGIPDLQFFNKTIRHHLGESPRKIRRSALVN